MRWHLIRQAKREMVLWTDWVSVLLWLPATVSVTTKSMGLSVDRPIWWRERSKRSRRHAGPSNLLGEAAAAAAAATPRLRNRVRFRCRGGDRERESAPLIPNAGQSPKELPGTCRCCCRGCTPPPPSGRGTECRRCCAGLCCLWPEGKESGGGRSARAGRKRGRQRKSARGATTENAVIFERRRHLHPVCLSEPPRGCFCLHRRIK